MSAVAGHRLTSRLLPTFFLATLAFAATRFLSSSFRWQSDVTFAGGTFGSPSISSRADAESPRVSSKVTRQAGVLKGQPPPPPQLIIPPKLASRSTGAEMSQLSYPTTYDDTFPVLEYPDPALRRMNIDVYSFGPDLEEFVMTLRKTGRIKGRLGVTAPQVGCNRRIIVMNVDDYCKKNKIVLDPSNPGKEWGDLIFINPKIVGYSEEETYVCIGNTANEQCYSSTQEGVKGVITRPTSVFITSVDVKGQPQKTKLDNPFMARIFQQMYDHLEGILFIDRLDPQAVDNFKKQMDPAADLYIYKLNVPYSMMNITSDAGKDDVAKAYQDALKKYASANEKELREFKEIEAGYNILRERLGLP